MTIRLEWRPMAPGNGPTISTSLTGREAQWLREAAEQNQVLEIGSAYGFSAIVMALGAEHVTAVDPHAALQSYSAMVNNVEAYGVTERITIEKGPSWDVLPRLLAEGRTFDLIWIDGDHEKPAVEQDVQLALPLLAQGGILACHDWDEATCPGVRAALEPMLGMPHMLIDTLAVYEGLKA